MQRQEFSTGHTKADLKYIVAASKEAGEGGLKQDEKLLAMASFLQLLQKRRRRRAILGDLEKRLEKLDVRGSTGHKKWLH
jgi:hypothetical protein